MEHQVELRFDPDGDQGYRVTLEMARATGRSMPVSGCLPANPNLLKDLKTWHQCHRQLGQGRITLIEVDYGDSPQAKVEASQQSANQLRGRFLSWLEDPGFRPVYDCLQRRLNQDDSIQLLLRTPDNELQELPWEEWDFFHHYRQAHYALSPLIFDQPTPRSKLHRSHSQLNILVILGDSEGIDLSADQQFFTELPNAKVVFLPQKTRRDVIDALYQQPWDIIFFAGHSLTESDGTGKLFLNSQESVTIDDLWVALRTAVDQGLQLAIFNSCDGLGLSRRLDDLHIPQMIVMREIIPDAVAHQFLKHLLQALSAHVPLFQAVRAAKERLYAEHAQYPYAAWLPVLWHNPATEPFVWPKPEPVSQLPRPSRSLNWQRVLASSLLITFLVMGVRHSGLLQGVELAAYDQMMRSRPSDVPDDRIVIVTIDDQDLKLQNQDSPGYSLRHDDLERLIKRIKPYQPAIVATAIIQDKKIDAKRYPTSANYLQTQRNYVNVCWVSPSEPAKSSGPPPELLATPQWQRVGFGDYLDDNEQVLRRQLFQLEKEPESSCQAQYPFSTIVGFNYLEVTGKLPDWYLPPTQQTVNGNNWNLNKIFTKKLKIGMGGYQQRSTDIGGQQILLNYRAVQGSPSKAFDQYPLRTILGTDILERNPNLIKGKIVLVGSIAKNNAKSKLTPYGKEIQAVIIYAQEISQLLDYAEGKRPLIWVWQAWQEALWLLGWAIVGSLVGWFSRDWRYLGLGEATTLIILYQLSQAIFNAGIWAPIVPSILAVIFCSFALYIQVHQRKMR